MQRETTPLRELPASMEADGVLLLADTGLGYEDGAESQLYAIVNDARDVSAMSDELELSATTWALRYHLTRERANALRMLNLDGTERVLEVGAGCGAVTRYLAERAGLVDAIEPQLSRARVAAARTADTSARVFCGTIEQVPDVPSWDLVLVNGVLEYIADGDPDEQRYTSFLSECARRLKPSGVLILAIENRIGAKYIAGAAEDHGGLPYQGVEGYAKRAPARTFTRPRLESMLERAGFTVRRTLHAFPDYKTTRVLFSDEALADSALHDFVWRSPKFPSRNTGMPDAAGVSERQFWRSALEAGVAHEFGNSFVVIAGTCAEAVERRWASSTAATYSSTGRRARFCTLTRVERARDRFLLRRERLSSEDSRFGPIRLAVSNDVLWPGVDAAALIAKHPDQLEEVVKSWLRLLDELPSDEHRPIDLVPHNLIIDGETIRVIDQEWYGPIPDAIHRFRGVALLAQELAYLTVPEQWDQCTTVGELGERIASACGIAVDESIWSEFLAWECDFQEAVSGGSPNEISAALRYALRDRPLADYELAPDRSGDMGALRARITELRARIELEQEWHRDQANRAEAAERREEILRTELERTTAELLAIKSSRRWKVANRLVTVARRGD